MEIIFKKDCELEIVIGLDDDGGPVHENETFQAGDKHDVDLLKEHFRFDGEPMFPAHSFDIQFGCGDCLYGLNTELLEYSPRLVSYRQLLAALLLLPVERLDDSVTVYNGNIDEYHGITSLGIEKETDVVDAGTPVLRNG